MKYAEELGLGMALAVHKWKPLPYDRFAEALHHWSTKASDERGRDAISTHGFHLTKSSTGVIYYRTKMQTTYSRAPDGSTRLTEGDQPIRGISTPFLMTMQGARGKMLAFEYVGDGGDGVPEGDELDERSLVAKTADLLDATAALNRTVGTYAELRA